jgi:hypothetical protein
VTKRKDPKDKRKPGPSRKPSPIPRQKLRELADRFKGGETLTSLMKDFDDQYSYQQLSRWMHREGFINDLDTKNHWKIVMEAKRTDDGGRVGSSE